MAHIIVYLLGEGLVGNVWECAIPSLMCRFCRACMHGSVGFILNDIDPVVSYTTTFPLLFLGQFDRGEFNKSPCDMNKYVRLAAACGSRSVPTKNTLVEALFLCIRAKIDRARYTERLTSSNRNPWETKPSRKKKVNGRNLIRLPQLSNTI